jgi:hypothetical protein
VPNRSLETEIARTAPRLRDDYATFRINVNDMRRTFGSCDVESI